MYIGYLCDSGRFHSMSFLETPFIKIIYNFMHCVYSEIKLFLFLFLNLRDVVLNWKVLSGRSSAVTKAMGPKP